MHHKRLTNHMRVLVFLLPVGGLVGALVWGQPRPAEETFPSSLHATHYGKQYFYSAANGGFEHLTGIPYRELRCQSCHLNTARRADGSPIDPASYEPSCADCHREPGAAVPNDVCLNCHNRQTVEYRLSSDVHRAAGMHCMDCHTAREMHGDGNRYVSLLEPGAMDAACENCHANPEYNQAHAIHQTTVDCKACHAQTVTACHSCHFDSELAGGIKRFAEPPLHDFMYLVRREGSNKVHPATLQTLVYRDRTFAVIAPVGPHTIGNRARACEDCHDNDNIRTYRATGALTVTRWNESRGRVDALTGIIPVPPDWQTALRLDYVTYTGDPARKDTDPRAWRWLKHGTDRWQMLFAKPLTPAQLNKLALPYQAPARE